MTNKLKNWSATAASNNATPPLGWPENMAPSDVNNTARQDRASIREWYDDAEWLHYGDAATAYTSTTLTITGDVAAKYVAGRKIRLDQDGSKVAKVESSSYSSPSTTVTVSGYTIAALPTIVELHIVSSEGNLPIIPPTVPRGYLDGCEVSKNSSDPDHDIDIAAGVARDSTDGYTFDVSAITKRLDASWAEGTNAGGFPSGLTLSADTWYRVFLIGKTDGTVDAGFDTSATATNLLSDATGYTLYRQIGYVRTDGSENIRPFRQSGDHFFFDSPYQQEGWTISTTATAVEAGCPPSCVALMSFEVRAGAGNTLYFSVRHPDAADVAPSASSYTFTLSANASESNRGSIITSSPVNGSSQLEMRASATGGDVLSIMSLGWIDKRAAQ